ncbi:MAG TPA: radical SAM protein [Methanocorpusculum sp.]|nr:radical SAM protein [Methanocorpusculum sp.]
MFEVSGVCNAKCPYCCNGNGIASPKGQGHFISVELFQKIIDHLLSQKIIVGGGQNISLYNWGEPLLHPHIEEIQQYLIKKSVPYNISTNGSIYKEILSPTSLSISTSGFSQSSYDRIHKVNFQTVLINVEKFSHDIDPQKILVKYFVYKFNIDEISAAKEYYENLGVRFQLFMPYFNDGNELMQYFRKELSPERYLQAKKDMFLEPFEYLRPLLSAGVQGCSFLKEEQLTIDETGQLLRCCTLRRTCPDYALGNVLNLTRDDIERLQKETPPICNHCISVLNPDQFHGKWGKTVPLPLQEIISPYVTYRPVSIQDAILRQKVLIKSGLDYVVRKFK